jgi:hypothetical protein
LKIPSMTRSPPRGGDRQSRDHVLEALDGVVDGQAQLGDLEIVLHQSHLREQTRQLVVTVTGAHQVVNQRVDTT